jgi:hypothetical protein
MYHHLKLNFNFNFIFVFEGKSADLVFAMEESSKWWRKSSSRRWTFSCFSISVPFPFFFSVSIFSLWLPFLFSYLIIFLFLFSWLQYSLQWFFLFFIILPLCLKYSVVFFLSNNCLILIELFLHFFFWFIISNMIYFFLFLRCPFFFWIFFFGYAFPSGLFLLLFFPLSLIALSIYKICNTLLLLAIHFFTFAPFFFYFLHWISYWFFFYWISLFLFSNSSNIFFFIGLCYCYFDEQRRS